MTRFERAAEAAYVAYLQAGGDRVQSVGPYDKMPEWARNIARAQAFAVIEALGPVTEQDIEAFRAEIRSATA